MRIFVFIPTRNRHLLAQQSALSALAQRAPELAGVLLSDNSDDAGEQQKLASWSRAQGGKLAYLRPPRPLNMADHWDWAFGEALAKHQPTHLVLLTDRMVLKDGAIAELAGIGARHPGAMVSFLHDRVNDLATPVRLERERWSGAVVRIESRHLLDMSQRCAFHTCLPRLMNALTPAAAFDAVKRTYGNYCKAISPDFGFGYRWLTLHPDFLYYDKALMIHSALSRSNGFSATRGVLSADAQNFRRVSMGGVERLPHAPYPELMTLGNFILEEYGAAREGNPAAYLPDVDPRAYLKMLYHDIAGIDDPAMRKRQLELLYARGHAAELRVRRAREAFKRNTKWLERGVKRLVAGDRRAPAARTFDSVEDALAWDRQHPQQRLTDTAHLGALRPQVLEPPAHA